MVFKNVVPDRGRAAAHPGCRSRGAASLLPGPDRPKAEVPFAKITTRPCPFLFFFPARAGCPAPKRQAGRPASYGKQNKIPISVIGILLPELCGCAPIYDHTAPSETAPRRVGRASVSDQAIWWGGSANGAGPGGGAQVIVEYAADTLLGCFEPCQISSLGSLKTLALSSSQSPACSRTKPTGFGFPSQVSLASGWRCSRFLD